MLVFSDGFVSSSCAVSLLVFPPRRFCLLAVCLLAVLNIILLAVASSLLIPLFVFLSFALGWGKGGSFGLRGHTGRG